MRRTLPQEKQRIGIIMSTVVEAMQRTAWWLSRRLKSCREKFKADKTGGVHGPSNFFEVQKASSGTRANASTCL